jgi:site-specific recombinase XerC
MPDGAYSTALIVTTEHDIALRDELLSAGKAFRAEARADRTRQAYARAWHSFEVWCAANDAAPLPASPETIAAWLTAMATGIGNGKPMARSSINQALSAVLLAHRTAGHSFDRKHPLIAETWRGISRSKAEKDDERQAAALMGEDLQAVVRMLSSSRAIDTRDRALLLLGWAGALRRSELVGLDWQRKGSGTGSVKVDELGVTIRLARSKSSQDKAVQIKIPREDMPAACDAIEAWAATARLEAGLFRPIDQRHTIGAERLTDHSVSRIIKGRLAKLVRARGKTKDEAREIVRAFSVATVCVPATQPRRRAKTCRAIASAGTRAISRRRWSSATCARPRPGRSPVSRG